MTFLDRAFAVLGLVLLTAFLGIVVWRVPVWPLIVVFAVGIVLAAFDFARTSTLRSRRERREGSEP